MLKDLLNDTMSIFEEFSKHFDKLSDKEKLLFLELLNRPEVKIALRNVCDISKIDFFKEPKN